MGLLLSRQEDAELGTGKIIGEDAGQIKKDVPVTEEMEDTVPPKRETDAVLSTKNSQKDTVQADTEQLLGVTNDDWQLDSSDESSSETETEITEQLQMMLAWEADAEKLKTVLTKKLTKLLRHPETIVFEHERGKLWLFYRLVEELAWLELDRALQFYIEWAKQQPSLAGFNLSTATLRSNFAKGAEYLKPKNQHLKWEQRRRALNPAVVVFPDIC